MIKNWDLWRELLRRFMENLEMTFGKEELRTRYFEVWNEPDGLRGAKQKQFFRLYDEFAHAVKSFDSGYRIGGPVCYNLYSLKDFLDHITGPEPVSSRARPAVPLILFTAHLRPLRCVAEYPGLEYRNPGFSALFMVKLVDCLKTIER